MFRRSGFVSALGLTGLVVGLGVTLSCEGNTVHRVDVPANRDHRVATTVDATTDAPANAILIIGDGFGLGQITLASTALHGPDGGFALESAPSTGLMRTWSADRFVTDSAASATAMATGFKTNRRIVGMTPDGASPTNLFEAAQDAGFATGVITTSGLMDATPAGFTVHHPNRYDRGPILAAMLDAGHDVLLGAHWGLLDDARVNDALQRAEGRGVTVIRTEAALYAADGPLVGLFDPREESPEAGGPPLAVSVRRALDILTTDGRPFLLLVETEETDEQAHANDTGMLIRGARELDDAVHVALDVAGGRGDTLVLVTADHETGGGAVTGGKTAAGGAEVDWLSGKHTGTWVPLFAFGPGAGAFSGVYDNTYLGPRIARLLGIDGLPAPTRTAH